ncbi:MAG TPA: NUDIX hydrolase [Methylomirabilota bacterium]|nr:NUDIX hydrolase [Methylomirabilota bacterium]
MGRDAQTALPDPEVNLGDVSRFEDSVDRPLPALDLRVVLFTVADARLLIALTNSGTGFELPRGLPSPAETLDTTARRIVLETIQVHEQYLEQLYTLSVHEGASWSVIISYVGLVGAPPQVAVAHAGCWRAVADASLAPTDRMVVDYALVRLRAKLGYTNIAFHLLPERFTLSELQETYETILARRLDKRNFRRRMIASGILLPTGDKRREGSHRPATLYRFKPGDDRETYLTPPWAEGA